MTSLDQVSIADAPALDRAVERRHAGQRTGRRWVSTTVTYLVLFAAATLTLAPFVLSFMTAFKTPRQMANQAALATPDPVTFENFTRLVTDYNFVTPVVVTAQVVAVVLIGQMIFSIMAAFAFAKLQFPMRDTLFWLYLATLMVPQVVLVVPLFTMFTQIGLRNTFWALVLPWMFASPYAVFLLRQYFMGIPDDLIAAARIDGASTWRILWQIVVPMSRPIIATLAIITIVSHWNNFMWPLVITTGQTWQVITVATASLQTQHNANWTLVMAATTVAMAPLLVLYAIFQRHVINSISLTGFK